MRCTRRDGKPRRCAAYQDFRAYLIEEVGIAAVRELVDLDRSIAVGQPLDGNGEASSTGGRVRVARADRRRCVRDRASGDTALVAAEVAVKIIRAEFANEPEFIRRFEAEAQMVASIEHANVVPLYDYWREPDRRVPRHAVDDGRVAGSRLDGPWSVAATLVLVEQIAAALDAAHRQGVVHRDVKPENILFDAEGRAYLSDFGIALEAEQRIVRRQLRRRRYRPCSHRPSSCDSNRSGRNPTSTRWRS